MLGNFSCFCCRLLNFFIINFFKKSPLNTIRVSNGFDPDQDRHFVGPDLGPNRLQMLLADDKKWPQARRGLMPFKDKTFNVSALGYGGSS